MFQFMPQGCIGNLGKFCVSLFILKVLFAGLAMPVRNVTVF